MPLSEVTISWRQHFFKFSRRICQSTPLYPYTHQHQLQWNLFLNRSEGKGMQFLYVVSELMKERSRWALHVVIYSSTKPRLCCLIGVTVPCTHTGNNCMVCRTAAERAMGDHSVLCSPWCNGAVIYRARCSVNHHWLDFLRLTGCSLTKDIITWFGRLVAHSCLECHIYFWKFTYIFHAAGFFPHMGLKRNAVLCRITLSSRSSACSPNFQCVSRLFNTLLLIFLHNL